MGDSTPGKCLPLKLLKCESFKMSWYTCGFSVAWCVVLYTPVCTHFNFKPIVGITGTVQTASMNPLSKKLSSPHIRQPQRQTQIYRITVLKKKSCRGISVVQNQNTPASTALIRPPAWLWTSPLSFWSFSLQVWNKRTGPFKPMLFDSLLSLVNLPRLRPSRLKTFGGCHCQEEDSV